MRGGAILFVALWLLVCSCSDTVGTTAVGGIAPPTEGSGSGVREFEGCAALASYLTNIGYSPDFYDPEADSYDPEADVLVVSSGDGRRFRVTPADTACVHRSLEVAMLVYEAITVYIANAEQPELGSVLLSATRGFDVPWEDRVDFVRWQPPLPPGQDSWMTEPPSRWPGLRAHLALPPTVASGDLVDYVVVLQNVSDDPVDLRPCGGYEQEVRRVGAGFAPESVPGGTSSYRLSCDGDPTLLPGESRRYAMRIRVPSNLTGNDALFRWGLVDNMPDYEAQQWVPLSPS